MEIFKIVEKINEFSESFSELTEGNAKSITDLIIDKVGVLKIKISHDHFRDLDHYHTMRLDLEENRIEDHIVLDGIAKPEDIVPGFKMILSSIRTHANYAIPVVRRCNGVILHVGEYITDSGEKKIQCKVMSIPVNDLTTKIDKRRVGDYLANNLYDIYMINDGTTINIYYDENCIWYDIQESPDDLDDVKKVYHKGRWMFSTKNAVDVENMEWRGTTYGEIIFDILKMYPDFDLEKLDKRKSYTIGFTHPAHHPFGQPAEWTGENTDVDFHKKAWFIQSTDLDTGESYTEDDIGLPFQEKHSLEEFRDVVNVNDTVDVDITSDDTSNVVSTSDDNATCFQNILNRAHSSMEQYSRGVRMNIISDEKQEPPKFFGVFLRSRDESKTKQFSDVLVESSLWIAIRKAIYQKPFIPNKVLRDRQGQNFKNFTYVILDSYLNAYKHKEFILLFPQFKHYYTRMDKTVNLVSDMIMNSMQKNGKLEEYGKNVDDDVMWMYEQFHGIVTDQFRITDTNSHDGNYGGPTARGRGRGRGGRGRGGRGRGRGDSGISSLSISINDKKVIKQIICHPKYTDIYFHGLYYPEYRLTESTLITRSSDDGDDGDDRADDIVELTEQEIADLGKTD